MVRSMTGFGRGVTTTENYQLTVEIRSVNHRFLEIYTKFPKEWSEVEMGTKKLLSQYVHRGKLDVTVNLKSIGNDAETFQINWPLIESYKKAKNQLIEVLPIEEKWTMDEIFSLENALIYEKQEILPEELQRSIENAVIEAATHLIEMREKEGQQLKQTLLQYKDEMMLQVEFIRSHSQTAVEKYREKLIDRIKQFASGELVEERILAEVAIFAERVDISEELDRLSSHFRQLEGTLEESNSIGRKLDFLLQEMHREINTIGSKNQSSEVSVAVVQAKTILEKMREQVQNIE
ncbi:YicC/YloC family endoribonuclease [Lysinibacillus endophyticus]|uniref:YicC family protein n=1 Tax=Ureibacillus endophyticus TaxID=1978490 RepID=A0A494ZBB2_9BACL|nr:YicC/YloC family endoribonuclease [Lysinibacillus endophyticus]RKQ19737.1 YicC family protein [Lysinibacillus endophyticus]